MFLFQLLVRVFFLFCCVLVHNGLALQLGGVCEGIDNG